MARLKGCCTAAGMCRFYYRSTAVVEHLHIDAKGAFALLQQGSWAASWALVFVALRPRLGQVVPCPGVG
jgi:hypothetical protein